MTPLTVVGGPAELGGLRVEVSGMCLDKQVQTLAGASAAYLLIKWKKWTRRLTYWILFSSLIQFESLSIRVASVRTTLLCISVSPELSMGLGRTMGLLFYVDLGSSPIDFSTHPLVPFPLLAGCELTTSILACYVMAVASCHIHMSAPACRDFRMIRSNLCVLQIRKEAWWSC